MNPAPGVTLSISSATAMQLCISHIRRSLGILHSSGYAAETSRAERHPSSASKGSFVFVCPHRCAFVQSVCFCTIQWCQIDAHAVSSFGQNAAPSTDITNASDNDVVVSSVHCIHFCILMYHRPRDNLCFNYLSRTHHITCEHRDDQPS